MSKIILLLFAVGICALCCGLGEMGLRRLDRDVEFPRKEAWAIGLPSAMIGLHVSHLSVSEKVDVGWTISVGIFFALLAIAALIDAKTRWAPTEIILPMCLVAPLSVSHQGFPEVTSDFLMGGTLFAVIWGLWFLQDGFGTRVLPPADSAALLLPWISLATWKFVALNYVLLTACLSCVALAPLSWLKTKVDWTKEKFPLLAIAFPVLLICLLAEKI